MIYKNIFIVISFIVLTRLIPPHNSILINADNILCARQENKGLSAQHTKVEFIKALDQYNFKKEGSILVRETPIEIKRLIDDL